MAALPLLGDGLRLVVDASASVAAESSRETHQRLLRTEIAAVIAVVALEASQRSGMGEGGEAGMTLYHGLPGVLPDPAGLGGQQWHLEHPRGQRRVRAALRGHRDPGMAGGPRRRCG